MDEDIEQLVVRVRADTGAFARDVADLRGQLDGPLAAGAERAGRAIEAGLLRAVRTGKFGFEDLKRVALSVLAEIAEAAVRAGIGAIGKAGGGHSEDRGGGIGGGLLGGLVGAIGGPAGRATGGPVTPGTAYLIGERGPEVFVPTSSGRVETGVVTTRDGAADGRGQTPTLAAGLAAIVHSRDGWSRGGGIDAPRSGDGRQYPAAIGPVAWAAPREVRVAITVNARGGDAPGALAKSSRQVARAVKSALGSID